MNSAPTPRSRERKRVDPASRPPTAPRDFTTPRSRERPRVDPASRPPSALRDFTTPRSREHKRVDPASRPPSALRDFTTTRSRERPRVEASPFARSFSLLLRVSTTSLTAVLAPAPLAAAEPTSAGSPTAPASANKAWRQKAADRPRGILFNNGRNLAPQPLVKGWMEFTPSPADLRTGQVFNEIEVFLASASPQPVKWLDLMLTVRHPTAL